MFDSGGVTGTVVAGPLAARPFELPPDPQPEPDLERLRALDRAFAPAPEAFLAWPTAAPGPDPDTARRPSPPVPACAEDPSGWRALELDAGTADPAALSDAQLVEGIAEWERLASWASARQARLLAEFARRRPGDDPERALCDPPGAGSSWAPDEIGLALTTSRGAAAIRLDHGVRLSAELAPTLRLLEQGQLDTARARAICLATAGLPAALAANVQDRVLCKAPRQTLAQLRAALSRAVLAADPLPVQERHRRARQERRVRVVEEADGMASLWALLGAPDAVCAYEWLTRLARSLGPDDPRPMDARRADLLAALLTGRLQLHGLPVEDEPAPPAGTSTVEPGLPRPPAAGTPLVHVVVDYSTLTGADDQPGELAGYGPIPADLAREIAADAVWRRLVVDPLSGAVLDHGRTVYRPPAALTDFVRARDAHCRSPICRRRALDCEIDHVVPWSEGGATAEANLADLCPLHHRLKHEPGWQVRPTGDGALEWVTPTGHRYRSDPHDYRPREKRPPPS